MSLSGRTLAACAAINEHILHFFAPTTDKLFGPRPNNLIETPLWNEKKPMFIAGPRDDSNKIIRQLEKAVGKDNFDFICPVF